MGCCQSRNLQGDFRSKFEASWAVSNLAHGGSSAQVMELSNDEYITVLCNLLDVPNADFICNLLDTLFIVLKTAQNLYPDRLKQIEDSVEVGIVPFLFACMYSLQANFVFLCMCACFLCICAIASIR